jgi:hypothetical protein
MKRPRGLWLFVITLIFILAAALCAQEGGNTGTATGPGAGFGPRPGQQFDMKAMQKQMIEGMLQFAGLNDTEKAAATKAMETKMEARQTLNTALMKLFSVSNDPNAPDKDLKDTLTAYRTALAQYQKTVTTADEALSAKLSLRSKAKAMAMGILDNGAGGMGMMGMGMGMGPMGGAGRMGGMRPGGNRGGMGMGGGNTGIAPTNPGGNVEPQPMQPEGPTDEMTPPQDLPPAPPTDVPMEAPVEDY